MKTYILFFVLLITSLGYAQRETNIWYFGEKVGLDFNSGAPVEITDSAMVVNEGCSTIADSSGSLLFYTDGQYVWNRQHQLMPNGSGLIGASSTQAAIIIPKPGNSTIYYIFTVGANVDATGFNYSEVDMTLDSGLGDITVNKNVSLQSHVTEKLTATFHANGTDIWVLAHGWGVDGDTFFTYLVTSAGVNMVPVTSTLGAVVGTGATDSIGQLKIAPNGSKVAAAYFALTKFELYDFDNTTGQVSNAQVVSGTVLKPYGVEFSPSSDILYMSNYYGELYQYNLLAADIPGSETLIYDINYYAGFVGALQLAPDGKIYNAFSQTVGLGVPRLNVIHNPNALGTACNYEYIGLVLTRNGLLGLPSYIQSYFNVSINVSSQCLGTPATFSLNSNRSISSYTWDFGDGATSSLENPVHTYATTGTYTVTLTAVSGGTTTTDTTTITIYEQPTATQPQDIKICDADNDGFVTYDLSIQDTAILNGQDSSVFEVKYYASMADYTAGNVIADPTTYTNPTAYDLETIIASVQNSAHNACEASTSFTFQVFESPQPSMAVPKLASCDNTSVGTDTDGQVLFDLSQNQNAILNGQTASDFSIAYYTDSALTNQILNPNSYANTTALETIYVQVSNIANNNCQASTSFELEVYTLPTINSPVSLKQCDDDLDGYSPFNLNEAIPAITTNAATETIQFYSNQADALAETNPIADPTSYINATVNTDTVWATVANTNHCIRVAQVDLIVSTTQIPNTFMRDFYACDDLSGGSTIDGISSFDFSSVTAEIEALFPAGQQLLISYYRNQVDALAENNPISDTSNYQNIGYANNQDIYVRVDSQLDNACLGLGHHITLHVEYVPIAHTVLVAEQCDADGDGMYPFDTSSIESTLIAGQTNVTVSYTDASGVALSSPLPNPFLTATQTITARLTNSTSQDPNGACYGETSIHFAVAAAAVANPVPDQIQCDDVSNDGTVTFDTSTIQSTILGSQTGMLVQYTDASGVALPSPLPNPFTTATQTVHVRVENPLSSTCFAETTIDFVVSEQAIAYTPNNDIVCDDVSNDGLHTFTLSAYTTEVLNGQAALTFEVLYFDSLANATSNTSPLTNSHTVSTSSETVYARIQNRSNTNCYAISSFQLGVHYYPIAHQPDAIIQCDDVSNDGISSFDLRSQDSSVLNGLAASDFTVSYHLSQQDADLKDNELASPYTNISNPQRIYVRLENNAFRTCYTTSFFDIHIIRQPVLQMPLQWPICEGTSVNIVADAGYDEYLWSTGETSQSITVNTPGSYQVTVANVMGGVRCEDSKTISVVNSNRATITAIETADWTLNDNMIAVFVSGDGDYEYSIDGYSYQDSSEFSNLYVSDYTVYVRDKNGCGIAEETIYLLYYPKYFTPNGDNYNDTWQLINGASESSNIVYIYDRYGKLIKQLNANQAWNGTLSGVQLPAADYWFVVKRANGKEYRGHFSLKR